MAWHNVAWHGIAGSRSTAHCPPSITTDEERRNWGLLGLSLEVLIPVPVPFPNPTFSSLSLVFIVGPYRWSLSLVLVVDRNLTVIVCTVAGFVVVWQKRKDVGEGMNGTSHRRRTSADSDSLVGLAQQLGERQSSRRKRLPPSAQEAMQSGAMGLPSIGVRRCRVLDGMLTISIIRSGDFLVS